MKQIIVPTLVFTLAAAALTGCMTRSRVIAEGEQAEVVAGFSQDDIERVIKIVGENINQKSARYAKPGVRRVVNVKDITNDTLSRGRDANALAEALGQGIREWLMEGDSFIVYNEKLAANAAARGQAVAAPEYVLYGRLTQRNMRKDNGDVYQEFSLNVQLVGVAGAVNGLEIWQKRIPVRKEVDKANSMN